MVCAPTHPRQARVALRAITLLTLLLPAAQSWAGVPINQWDRKSHVSDVVTDNHDGTWTYDFTVHNDSTPFFGSGFASITPEDIVTGMPILVDWELPWFDDAGFTLADVVSPTGWAAAIETIGTANPTTGWGGVASWQDPGDDFYFGPDSPFTLATQVLHWFNTCWAEGGEECAVGGIEPGGSLSGFGFDAVFDKTAAPYQASWMLLPVRSGDPAFPLGGVPASPLALGSAVPVPGTLALALLGVAGLFASHRRADRRVPV